MMPIKSHGTKALLDNILEDIHNLPKNIHFEYEIEPIIELRHIDNSSGRVEVGKRYVIIIEDKY